MYKTKRELSAKKKIYRYVPALKIFIKYTTGTACSYRGSLKKFKNINKENLEKKMQEMTVQ